MSSRFAMGGPPAVGRWSLVFVSGQPATRFLTIPGTLTGTDGDDEIVGSDGDVETAAVALIDGNTLDGGSGCDIRIDGGDGTILISCETVE